ncbi:hypothetical protein SESBI_49227 [Sesbania bispinosa]|nr:hypothetical protein SESBI_49227 [Sesbania bispinosa]
MVRDFIPNGLLLNKSTPVGKVLDRDRWSQIEARAAELLSCIQPSPSSELRRKDVVAYLQNLLMNSIPCQVFTFGSVPLKTYLPDGDIDLTTFADKQFVKDSMIPKVLDILKHEENNEVTQFHVKEVRYIQAKVKKNDRERGQRSIKLSPLIAPLTSSYSRNLPEVQGTKIEKFKRQRSTNSKVKIIKCIVGNFAVDISFNQLGGLSTLCFLEEVDDLISHNHLFKRSVILIKAWCFYESRILGSHHGLMSTYALEILVLYIFHVYNNKFAGPLEVLYRFLDFFSRFDWDNYGVSLRGPVPKRSLPIMKAEPPRKDCQHLLLSESFLNACNSCYSVMPMLCSSQENQVHPFVSKYVDIIDPLRANNNLGRSISKANFFRIRSAIAFGAQRLVRLLDCSEDNLIAEFDFFFKNTWNRNGNGYWIDSRAYNLYVRYNNAGKSTHHKFEVEEEVHGISQNPANHLKESKQILGTSEVSTVSSETNDIPTGTMTSHIVHTSSMNNADSEVPTQHLNTPASEPESGQIHSASSITMASSSISEVLDKDSIQEAVSVKSSNASSPSSPHGLASGYRHADSLAELPVNTPSLESQNMPHSQDLVPVSEPVDPNVGVAHLDHEKQMAAKSGSSSVNSPCKTDSGSDSLKEDVETTEQEGLTKENVRDDPPDVRSIDSNVMSSIASSSCTPARHETSSTNLSSSSFSKGSSSKTSQPEDVSCQLTAGTDIRESKTSETLASYLQALQLGSNIQKLKPVFGSSIPDIPTVVGPTSSRGALDKPKRLLPLALDSPGSRTQFPFPLYNVPTETGTTYMDAELTNLNARESRVILDPTQRLKQLDIFHAGHIRHDATREYFVRHRFDILNGDSARYWLNLQYGRICQNLESEGPLLYPHPVVPPKYLMGQFLWHRRGSEYMNLRAHGAPLVPDMQREFFHGLHAGFDQPFSLWLPRITSGTGTYIPNPISYHQVKIKHHIKVKAHIELLTSWQILKEFLEIFILFNNPLNSISSGFCKVDTMSINQQRC